MPKKLKVHPNERVDIPDFNRASQEYTQESVSFNALRTLLDKRSRVLDGFRLVIPDQTANPGQVTIFNGAALNRDGQIMNNEDQTNTSKTVTLTGANTEFYIEIEFVESDSDVDSRAFWDPTFDQTSPIPDGKEFQTNVATRETPDWRIVSPVSTTGFAVTTDSTSLRVPIAMLVTDGSNEITGAVNPGLTQVFPATVLETDHAASAAVLRVIDARLFTTGDTVTVDVGGAAPQVGITVGALSEANYANNEIPIAPALTVGHAAGAIVRRTSGTGQVVQERLTGSTLLDLVTLPPGDADVQSRLFQGDERRGSALSTSKETFGSRDDTQLRSLKDQVDFLAAQIRELKFGAQRTEVVSQAPPATFSSAPRYFDPAGGVLGARGHTLSIGNGTTSFGDFNGTDEVPFIAAIAALPAGGGTIYIKNGTYTFLNKVVVDTPVRFVGESPDNAGGSAGVVLTIGAVADPLIEIDSGAFEVGFTDMRLVQAAASTDNAISVIDDGDVLEFDNVRIEGNINVSGGTGAVTWRARRLDLRSQTGGGGVAAFNCVSTRSLGGSVADSVINVFAGTDGINATISDLHITTTQFTGGGTGESCITILANSDRLSLRNCRMAGSQMFTAGGTFSMTELLIDGLTITSHTDLTGLLPMFDFYSLFDSKISRVVADTLGYLGSGSGDPPEVFLIGTAGGDVVFDSCDITAPSAQFVKGISATTGSGTLWVTNNVFSDMHIAVEVNGPVAYVRDNVLISTGANGLYGVRCIPATSFQLDICNNRIITGTGVDAIGVYLDNAATTWVDAQICGNNISGGNTSTTSSESKGVKIIGTIGSVDISNNHFDDLVGSGVAECVGISVEPTVVNGMLNICSNRLTTIGNGSSGVDASAIRVASVGALTNTTINGNVVVTVSTTSLVPVIDVSYASSSGDCQNLQICENVIQGGGGSTTGTTTVGAIQVSGGGSGDDIRGLTIRGNHLDLDGVGSISGIRVSPEPAAIAEHVIITDNVVQVSSTGFYGIHVTTGSGGTTAVYRDLLVRGNSVHGVQVSLATARACIEIDDAGYSRVVVSHNIVHEAGFHASRHGIRCQSVAAGAGITVLGNDIEGQTGNRGATGVGLVVDNFDDVNISNNNVRWIGAEAGGPGIGIQILNGTRGVCSGNTVLPMTGAGDEITATGCTQMFAVGNSVGNTVNNGTIGWSGTGMLESPENNLTGV